MDGILSWWDGVELWLSGLGFVFQGFNLLPRMSLQDNVALPLVYAGVDRETRQAKARELLAKVGLGKYAESLPNRISGGQQQRVAIARALMMDPAVLLFDEPTAALDPEITKEVADIIRKLGETGITQVVVTHEVEFARRVATQLIYLEQGEIVEMGPASHFAAPQTRRFAEFLQH